jgi:isopenicillin-N N-acyltransferase-like protein
MDIMSYVEGHQVLLRIQSPESDIESLVFTCAGLLALCGMNNAPFGVNCNTLMQLGCRPDGLPIAFVVRSLLEKASFDEAVAFLENTTHAAGQNYTLSTADRVGSFECSPNKVVEYRPRADGLRVCHTNHPLANDDTGRFEELAKSKSGSSQVHNTNSCSRLASIAARTVNREGIVNLEDLKSALRARDDPDNPVCRDHSTNIEASVIAYTAGSLIYEYGQKVQLHLAAGPPSESDFVNYRFSGA